MGGVWVKDLVIVLKYFVSKLSMDEVFFCTLYGHVVGHLDLLYI